MSRNTTEKISLDHKALSTLAAAIVKQACVDYLKYHKRREKLLKRDPSKMIQVTKSKWQYDIKEAERIIKESRAFLLSSEHYSMLCNANPVKIVEQLDAMIAKGKYTLAGDKEEE